MVLNTVEVVNGTLLETVVEPSATELELCPTGRAAAEEDPAAEVVTVVSCGLPTISWRSHDYMQMMGLAYKEDDSEATELAGTELDPVGAELDSVGTELDSAGAELDSVGAGPDRTGADGAAAAGELDPAELDDTGQTVVPTAMTEVTT